MIQDANMISDRVFTCIATEFDAFRNPIISFPSGSIRLKVTVAKRKNKTILKELENMPLLGKKINTKFSSTNKT